MKDVNIYQDAWTGGWVLEVREIGGRWYRVGYFGSYAAARKAGAR